MNSTSEGLLDTNVFVHAHTNDSVAQECRDFLAALERGQVQGRLEPLVAHELTYVLPRVIRQMTRADVAQYLLMVLGWRGVTGPKDILVDAVIRWRDKAGLSFVDAYLAALAAERRCAVYTKNLRDFEGQGSAVPRTLPKG